jgi:hypothetical protein
MNGLNTNVMKPVFKEVVFIVEVITGIKIKTVSRDPKRLMK